MFNASAYLGCHDKLSTCLKRTTERPPHFNGSMHHRRNLNRYLLIFTPPLNGIIATFQTYYDETHHYQHE